MDGEVDITILFINKCIHIKCIIMQTPGIFWGRSDTHKQWIPGNSTTLTIKGYTAQLKYTDTYIF